LLNPWPTNAHRECWHHIFSFPCVCRRASSSSSWVSCGIHCHGSWRLQLSWPLHWRMEG
jgi:hypothetical protein